MKVAFPLYERFFDCVHCGLCLAQCPTYAELGDENDSPRGRIRLMRAVVEGRIELTPRVRLHLDRCLDCRACETACPSGVGYGRLIESLRTALAEAGQLPPPSDTGGRLLRWMILHVVPNRDRLRNWLRLASLSRQLGVIDVLDRSGFGRLIPSYLRRLEAMVPRDVDASGSLVEYARPRGAVRARVAFFVGCVGEAVFARANRAALRVLLANGCEVFCPPQQVCCGAIHHHNGQPTEARRLARINIAVFEDLERQFEPIDAVVTNVAGCGAMLKEYGELLADDPDWAVRARAFAGRVRDITEWLASLPLVPPRRRLEVRVACHEPCHLCHAQGVRDAPRAILRAIPGLELVELSEADWCCGAAGTYNLTQPEMAGRLARRKLANVERSGAQVLAAANAGCMLHLAHHLQLMGRELRIVHPVELLAEAYGD